MALSKTDWKQLNEKFESIDQRFDRQKEEIVEQVSDIIDEKLNNLKSEFFEKIDPILKEVVTSREERPIIENRLEALEEIHRSGKHSLPAS